MREHVCDWSVYRYAVLRIAFNMRLSLVSDAHQNIALWGNKICIVGKRNFSPQRKLGRTDFPHNALSPQCIIWTYVCTFPTTTN